MPNGPAKQLVDHLDTLESGGTVDVNVGESVVYRFGIDYYKDAIGGAPIYQLHRVTCPIFFLQGGDDNIYRRSDARLGYELMRSHDLPTAYREISEGDHTLGNVAPEGAEAVLAWLREMSFLGGALPESEV